MRRPLKVAMASAVVAAALGAAAALADQTSNIDGSGGTPINFAGRVGSIAPLSSNPVADLQAMAQGIPGISSVSATNTTENGPVETELTFEIGVPELGGADQAEAMWKAAIFAGAAADRYAASGLPPVMVIHINLVAASGVIQPIGGGIGNAVPNQEFTDITPAVTNAVTARATQLGFSDPVVQTIRGIQDAMIIKVRADDPAAAVAKLRATGDPLVSFLGESPSTYEGVYLVIEDANGVPQFSVGAAPRDGSGLAWANPSSGLSIGDRISGQ